MGCPVLVKFSSGCCTRTRPAEKGINTGVCTRVCSTDGNRLAPFRAQRNADEKDCGLMPCHAYTHTHTHALTNPHALTRTHTHAHTHTYIYTYVHVCLFVARIAYVYTN